MEYNPKISAAGTQPAQNITRRLSRPFGAWTEVNDTRLKLTGVLLRLDGAADGRFAEAEQIGHNVAEQLIAAGADVLLKADETKIDCCSCPVLIPQHNSASADTDRVLPKNKTC
jgi:hypothetical protein